MQLSQLVMPNNGAHCTGMITLNDPCVDGESTDDQSLI